MQGLYCLMTVLVDSGNLGGKGYLDLVLETRGLILQALYTETRPLLLVNCELGKTSNLHGAGVGGESPVDGIPLVSS